MPEMADLLVVGPCHANSSTGTETINLIVDFLHAVVQLQIAKQERNVVEALIVCTVGGTPAYPQVRTRINPARGTYLDSRHSESHNFQMGMPDRRLSAAR